MFFISKIRDSVLNSSKLTKKFSHLWNQENHISASNDNIRTDKQMQVRWLSR